MKIAAIITDLNKTEDIVETADSVERADLPPGVTLKILIVMAASFSGDRGRVEALGTRHEDIEVASSEQENLFLDPISEAVEHAKAWGAENILFIRSGCEIERPFWTAVTQPFKFEGDVGAVCPKIFLTAEGSGQGNRVYYDGGNIDLENMIASTVSQEEEHPTMPVVAARPTIAASANAFPRESDEGRMVQVGREWMTLGEWHRRQRGEKEKKEQAIKASIPQVYEVDLTDTNLNKQVSYRRAQLLSLNCVLLSAEMVYRIGHADQKLYSLWQDVDYSLRVEGDGKSIYFVPTTAVWWKKSQHSFDDDVRWKEFLETKSKVVCTLRYGRERKTYTWLVRRLFQGSIESKKAILEGVALYLSEPIGGLFLRLRGKLGKWNEQVENGDILAQQQQSEEDKELERIASEVHFK